MGSPRLLLSPTLATVVTVDTSDTVDTVLATAGASMASVRPRLSPTSDMVDTVLVDTAATAMEDSTGDTTASVRLRPNPRLLPSPTLDTEVMEDTVLVAMEDTVVTVTAMASKIILCRRNHSIMHKNIAFLMYLQIYIEMQFCVINVTLKFGGFWDLYVN